MIVLVTPIDESAPKGRMILPQQQMIRDVLDHGAINVVVRERELAQALDALGKPPRMVITDSQAFGVVSKIVPESIPLTSFSILFARYKGELETAVRGAAALGRLRDGWPAPFGKEFCEFFTVHGPLVVLNRRDKQWSVPGDAADKR